MKKLFVSIFVVIVLVFGVFVAILSNNTSSHTVKKSQMVSVDNISIKEDEHSNIKDNNEKDIIREIDEDQVAKVKDSSYHLNLVKKPLVEEVVEAMHQMTHQKVRSEEKWGAIPMTQENINEIYVILKNNKTDGGIKQSITPLLKIAEHWKDGNFSHIVKEHNYLWDKLGGDIGEAYDVLSDELEREFIQNNFPSLEK